MALLIELAQKGYVFLEEHQGRGFLGGRDFRIKPVKRPAGEDSLESILFDSLFNPGKRGRKEVHVQDSARLIQSGSTEFGSRLQGDLIEQGLMDTELVRQRDSVSMMGFILIALGVVLAIAGSVLAGTGRLGEVPAGISLTGVGLGLTLAGGVSWSLARSWNIFSPVGLVKKADWSAFRSYLIRLTHSRQSLQPEWMETYFAYAVAFGIGDQWVRCFKEQGQETSFHWAGDGAGGPADGLVLAAVLATSAAATGGGSQSGGSGLDGLFRRSNS